MLKIYNEYKTLGVDTYYKTNSVNYYNPHREKIEIVYNKYILALINNNTSVLDIACGNGLISKIITKYNMTTEFESKSFITIEGCDPYFKNKYTTYNYSFQDIAKGCINKYYDLVICCYAFHLLDKSWYYQFLEELSLITKTFVIITPSKKININHPRWVINENIRDEKISIIILNSKSL